MQENLVIVESPAKAKTIEKFLGKEFLVKSSFGHIRDLAKKDLGIEIDNDFKPHYEISEDKTAVVSELNKLSKKVKTVWLASDEDREGEAIARHLYQTLGLKPDQTKRIVFHEITKNAILNAVDNPRSINMDLVNAQQARRILDRLVGFELSPVLWKKVKPSLSAGRVQSVAVRLIVEREKEIINFNTTDFFRITADFSNSAGTHFSAELNKKIKDLAKSRNLLELCSDSSFTIRKVEKKPSKRTPAAPFTTSTLQQEASRKSGMSVGQTMAVAQRLYESGLITYMRTDSQNLSEEAVKAISSEVRNNFGEKYLEPRKYKTKIKGAQEAHEAIRPSYIDRHTIEGSSQEKRLYELIWKRTVASQMATAEIDRTVAEIEIEKTKDYHFTASGEVIRFDGFLRLYKESTDDDNNADESAKALPPLTEGEKVALNIMKAVERFTSPPARYSEASLVKNLEELGIGRPSTYAPTISTVISRGYVIKESREGKIREYIQLQLKSGNITEKTLSENYGSEKNKLFPTDIGILVTDYLEEQFPDILDYNFTAKVEKEFDEIADGELEWTKMLNEFYRSFHPTVESAIENSAHTNSTRELGNDKDSGLPVYAKIGRYGPYIQLGENEDISCQKPKYAQLAPGQLIATITIEEALGLFRLPRNIGEYEDKDVVIGTGRFGPYVRHDGKFVSLKKEDNPYTIVLERAVELIEEKRKKERERVIRIFENDPETQVLNGRWGPYISCKGENYKIPKTVEAKELGYEDCMKLIEEQKNSPKKTVAKRGAKKTRTTTKAKK
ncbi:MAG: type I DNA topoisomerase [Rikenellaceae bacterium]|nr:type I DNA topoisomerase [Rikenellaceae bacterium]